MTAPRSGHVPVAAVMRAESPDAMSGLLGDALRQTGLWDAIVPSPAPEVDAGARRAIVVAAMSRPAPVDRGLVEEAVDLVRARGWSSVVVGVSLTARDRDLGDGVQTLARAAGLTGWTASGVAYDIVDLHEDLVPAPVSHDCILASHQVSRAWADAGLRVVVARNATDLADGFSSCLEVLTSVAAPVAGVGPVNLVDELHHYLPAHLALVDAAVSSHGFSGSSRLRRLDTCTLVVSDDALLADVLAAQLQGIDPGASRVVGKVIAQVGLPSGRRVVGDLSKFAGWQPAPIVVRDAIRKAGPVAERLASAALVPPVPGEAIDDPVLMSARRGLDAILTDGEDLWATALLTTAATTLAVAGDFRDAWSAIFAKDRVHRVEVPLGFDPSAYGEPEFLGMRSDIEPLELLLENAPVGPGGLRWRYADSSVVFQIERLVEAPFQAFVERVDVAQAIGLMADYLGGRVVCLARDGEGRSIRQAERNLYLPQPNYLAFWGAQPIDVCKIELVEYEPACHRLLWRTVASPNGSATYDDGAITFTPASDDRTLVTVIGRQLFTLPAFWKAVDLDRFPEVKNPLVEDAYVRFFSATFDNLEAHYEGRDFLIGKDPDNSQLPTATASLLAEIVRDWLAESPLSDRVPAFARGATSPPVGHLDEHGFRHFTVDAAGPMSLATHLLTEAQQLARDYSSAVAADWVRMLSR